jgi:hypothetical protein
MFASPGPGHTQAIAQATAPRADGMNTPGSALLYARFLKLAKSAYTLPAGVALSPLEALVLQEIFLSGHDHKPLTVKEALELKHLASPSTLHKKISHLRALQLLTVQYQGNNHRTKYLVLTPSAVQHFHELGQAMQKALDSTV